MSNYKHVVMVFEKVVERLVKFSGLDKNIVGNLVRFCRCLAKPKKDTIDLQIYKIVLYTYFDYMDQHLTLKIYHKIARCRPDGVITVEDFGRILCTFFTDDIDLKIDFVFALFDDHSDGFIDQRKVAEFIKKCWCMSDSDDADKDETFAELCLMANDCLDLPQNNGILTLDTFRAKVKGNPLVLSLLCQGLPPASAIERFRQKISDKSNLEIKAMFGNIRYELLYEVKSERVYYPIVLDLP